MSTVDNLWANCTHIHTITHTHTHKHKHTRTHTHTHTHTHTYTHTITYLHNQTYRIVAYTKYGKHIIRLHLYQTIENLWGNCSLGAHRSRRWLQASVHQRAALQAPRGTVKEHKQLRIDQYHWPVSTTVLDSWADNNVIAGPSVLGPYQSLPLKSQYLPMTEKKFQWGQTLIFFLGLSRRAGAETSGRD
jgi:hypothetical protein